DGRRRTTPPVSSSGEVEKTRLRPSQGSETVSVELDVLGRGENTGLTVLPVVAILSKADRETGGEDERPQTKRGRERIMLAPLLLAVTQTHDLLDGDESMNPPHVRTTRSLVGLAPNLQDQV